MRAALRQRQRQPWRASQLLRDSMGLQGAAPSQTLAHRGIHASASRQMIGTRTNAQHSASGSTFMASSPDLTEEERQKMRVYEGLKEYVEKKYPNKREWMQLVEEYNPRPPLVEPSIVDLRPPDRPTPRADRVTIPLDLDEKYRVTRKTKWIIKQLRVPQVSEVPTLLDQWVKTMFPKRSDWMDLLKELQGEKDHELMFQVFEFALFDDSFDVRSQDLERLLIKYMTLGRYDDVERLYGTLDTKGFPPDFVICTLLLDMYCNLKRLDKAREMYDRIRELGFVPDVAACTQLIDFYCVSGNPETGEMLLVQMENEKVHGTIDTYLAVLKGYGRAGKVSDAVRIFSALQYDQFLMPKMDTKVYSAVMDAYTQAKMFPSAVMTLEELLLLGFIPEDESVAFLISSFETKNQFEKALDVLLKLESKAVRPGPETLSALISWFGKLGLVEEAEILFRELEKKAEVPACKAYASLYATYARAGSLEKARNILDSVKAKKVELTDWAFEQMIQSLLDGKELEEAQFLRDQMVFQGYTPSDEIERVLLGFQAGSLFEVPSSSLGAQSVPPDAQSPTSEGQSAPSEGQSASSEAETTPVEAQSDSASKQDSDMSLNGETDSSRFLE